MTEETKKKISDSVKKYFKKHPEVIATLSQKRRETALKNGNGKWMKGKKHSEETKEKMSKSRRGENNYRWKGDRSAVENKHRLRGQKEWKEWRKSVFERDNYTCKQCNVRGGFLEPHHIIPIRLNGELFNTKNGITLCHPCHLKILGKEMNHAERYSGMIDIHNVPLLQI